MVLYLIGLYIWFSGGVFGVHWLIFDLTVD